MLRGQAPKVVGPSCCICCMVSVLINTCVPAKSLVHRKWEIVLILRGSGSAHPRVPGRALLSCGLSLMPRVLASWSGPAAPWCCSCTGTTRVQRIHTPDGPPQTRAVHAILTLVATFVTLLNSIVAFYVTAFLDFYLGPYRPLVSWLYVAPSC